MTDVKTKCRNEIRSFFGLTMVNLVLGGLIMAFGISIGVTQLLPVIETGQIALMPLVLIIAGFGAVGAGLFWLVKAAEIMDGIDDINTAYGQVEDQGNDEQITSLIIQMMTQYRDNQPVINVMYLLGRLGGFLFIIAGSTSLIYATNTLVNTGLVATGVIQIAGGIIAIGVGIGSLIIGKYFKEYSGVWEARLQEEQNIQKLLKKEMGTV
jgi:hypothetical protein